MRVASPLIAILALILLSGCQTGQPTGAKDSETAALALKPANYADLTGWPVDDHDAALVALRKSCARILKKPASAPFSSSGVGGTNADWQPACREAASVPQGGARAFFERHFQPWQATAEGKADGLFTGYYEASLNGSRTRHGPFQYPLRARPDDLVMVELGDFRDTMKGQRIAGKVVAGKLKPYLTHKEIDQGKLPPAQDKVLVWIDDPVDVFFLQIQGSGIVTLDDGAEMRVGYAAQNGHSYYAIGKELVKRGELQPKDVSMQSIRAWLDAHPEQAADIMYTNPSYVFFEQMKGDGPKGGEGVALTARRSLAVDRARIPYGAPVFVDLSAPVEQMPPLRQLMVAQDTGGAIRGPVRGDFFWGHGPDAEHLAGLMKSRGSMWLLLPKTVRP